MKQWLNGKEMGELSFSETPYKIWTAKPTGNLAIKYIPFEAQLCNNNAETILELTEEDLGGIETTNIDRIYLDMISCFGSNEPGPKHEEAFQEAIKGTSHTWSEFAYIDAKETNAIPTHYLTTKKINNAFPY
jgi:hypothetical protein